jgi:KaiC/GvpD/RAD55 family RecA-like ATPase
MADIETLLLSKTLQSGKLADVVARGIEIDHFVDDLCRDVYEWCLEFMRDHGDGPSLSATRKEFPGFKPQLSKDPLTYHMEEFVKHVKEVNAIELVRQYHTLIDDPTAIQDIEVHALDMAKQLVEVVPAPRAERLSEGKRRREEYYRRKKSGVRHGIPIGIDSYDEITLGIQPHELLIWGGPAGGGKTTAQQHTAINAYLNGRVVLFVSLEVEAEQILRRFDVMMANVRARALKALDLDPEEERKWHEILERCERERLEHDIIIRDDIRNCTVEKVSAEQLRYRPGMVVVDYLEEMSSWRGLSHWQSVQENGRGLKQNARVSRTPYVTGTQLSRETGETAYQSAQKIADMLIVLQPNEEDYAKNEMELSMRKYRDGPSRKTVRMRWDIENGDLHEIPFDPRLLQERGKSLTGRTNGKTDNTEARGAIAKAKAKRASSTR